MGCICSKAVTRSMSIRDSSNDQLFAFLRSANNSRKNKETSTTNPETNVETQGSVSDSTWDLLIPDFKREKGTSSSQDDIGDFGPARSLNRSKSCQNTFSREQEPDQNDKMNENGSLFDLKDRSLMGSRSFHTVDEFDQLLERIRKFGSRSTESVQDHYYYYSSGDVNQESGENREEDGYQMNYLKKLADNRQDLDGNMDDYFKNGATGWRRKAMAKGLRSLDVPTVEFPAIGRLRQQIEVEGQVSSPGTYITPKFGSYNHNTGMPATTEGDGGENSAFSSEILAAFGDCVQQMNAEK